MTLAFIIGYFLFWMLAIYWTPKMKAWMLVLIIYLAFMHYSFRGEINPVAYGFFAIVYLVKLIFVGVSFIRRIFTKKLYLLAKGNLPKISETESLALNAGEPWFEKEIFQGKPNFKFLHNLHKFGLTPEEQSFLDNETEKLCSMIDDWKINHVERDLPVELWAYIRDTGFFGLVIPKEFGGKGFSAAAHSEIVLKVATRSSSVAVTVMVPNSLGPGELLYHYGTDDQKNYYLPRLASGQEIPCFALTGVTAGSDATSIPDLGTVCMGDYKGEQVLGIRLTGVNKRYITLAPVATLVGLAFKLQDPDSLLSGLGHEGITCALLPHDHIGLEIGNRLYPLGQAFMNGTIRIKESFIPMSWVIGGQKMAGEGWRMLVECLSIGRSISLPAVGTANSLVSSVTTSAYGSVREQFKVPVASFEGVEDVLAKMAGLTFMMNATRQFTVAAVDSGIKPSVASAISKYHLTENGRTVLNYAMDVHGGRGIILGPNNYLGISYQGIPIGITVEGANIMTRNLMIFGQGAMRCHPYIRKEYEALASNNGLYDFDRALCGHIGYISHNKVRAFWHGWTLGLFAKGYNSSRFHSYYKQITRLSSAISFTGDLMLIVLGGKFKYKERLSARMGDAISYLYMGCSTLKYYEDNKEQCEDVFVHWALQHCLYNTQEALFDVMQNFEPSFLGKILRFHMFPYGRTFKKPSDKLEHQLVNALLNDGVTRQSFKQMCYIPMDIKDPIGRVEMAFQASKRCSASRVKIHKAIKARELPKMDVAAVASQALELGIITQEELSALNECFDLVNQVIQVDEFAPFELGKKNAHPNWH